MDFSEALKAMKAGKKVKRTELEGYFKLFPDNNIKRVVENGFCLLSDFDIRAVDWEIIEDSPNI